MRATVLISCSSILVLSLAACEVSLSTAKPTDAASSEAPPEGAAPSSTAEVGDAGLGDAIAAPTAPVHKDLWMQWTGSSWQYNLASTDLRDPPADWSDFGTGPLELDYGGSVIYRVLVDNPTSSEVPVEFKETLPCTDGGEVDVVLSDESFGAVGSWDSWHVVIGDDPVFKIKKGSGGEDGAHVWLAYAGGAWTYSWNGTDFETPPATGIVFNYGAGASDLEITIQNKSGAKREVVVSETRTLGTEATYNGREGVDKDMAWQLGGEDDVDSTWEIVANPGAAAASMVSLDLVPTET